MEPTLLDLPTLAASLGVLLLCVAGVGALPWREAELAEAVAAIRALPAAARALLPRARGGGAGWGGGRPLAAAQGRRAAAH